MKRLIKAFIFLFFALNGGFVHSQTTASVASNLVENHEIVSVRPIDIMTQPQTLMKLWIDDPIPLTFYTEQEKEVQKRLNDGEDAIIAYSPEDKIVTRDIDQEEITPFTWKWVYFEIEEENGGYTKAYLRRPSWWLEKTGATEKGKIVPLSMYEVGVEGDAKVMQIHPNQLDTRFWELNRQGDYVSRPITGKVEHYANNVVDLYFDDSSSNPLSVTTNHLIWSFDRDDWFRVDSLKIGEKLKTQRGNVTLTQRTPKEGWFIVYDLEVYRDHNFLVGDEGVLAHNGCIDKALKNLDSNKWHHILKGSKQRNPSKGYKEHGWKKLVANPNKDNVGKILTEAYKEGTEFTVDASKNLFKKVHKTKKGPTVEVYYQKQSNGDIKISDAWVRDTQKN